MKFITGQSHIHTPRVAARAATLDQYRSRLLTIAQHGGYDTPESSLNLPFDALLLEEVEKMRATKVLVPLKYILLVGIGGSNLGAKAVYDALLGANGAAGSPRFPRMIFVDTNDEPLLSGVSSLITHSVAAPEELLVISVSKSGGTTETIANIEIIFDITARKFGREQAMKRLVVITDTDSLLWNAAERRGVSVLQIPTQVGGRYSVFSAAGLFPLSAAGIDITALREGARDMREKCLQEQAENPALQSAVILAEHMEAGISITDNFMFNPAFESLGKWYRQLIAESIGKEKNKEGVSVRTGLTPTVSIGSTDLHSMGQLYLGGPKDKITAFMYSDRREEISVPSERLFPELVEMIDGKTTADISGAILEGTKRAYEKSGLPFVEIILDDSSPRSLGEFFQFKMMEVMYLGELLNINAFDQPNVEAYKSETKKILSA